MTEQQTWAAEPQKSNRGRKIILGLVAIVVAALAFFGVWFGLGKVLELVDGGAKKVKAGDCINQATEDMKIVGCTAADAMFKVVGVADGKTETEAQTSCTDVKEAEKYVFVWEGEKTATTKGRVICIAPNAK